MQRRGEAIGSKNNEKEKCQKEEEKKGHNNKGGQKASRQSGLEKVGGGPRPTSLLSSGRQGCRESNGRTGL